MITDNDTQGVVKPKKNHNGLKALLAMLAVIAVALGSVAIWQAAENNVSARGEQMQSALNEMQDSKEADKAETFEQGRQAGLDEAAEKRKAVLVLKEVDGNTSVDIGEYLSSCSDDANSICVEDFDSVKVCVIENGVTGCGVYGSEEWQ